MKWRMHGANPDKLYKQLGIDMPKDIIDFSTNTNVLSLEANIDLDIKTLINNYPDDESIELREFLSSKLGVNIEELIITNGSNEAIYIVSSLYKNAAIFHPTYSEYERALTAFGAKVSYIDNINQLNSRYDVLFLCNPNNPTGRYFNLTEMELILSKCNELNIDVVIDEAYIDFLYNDHKLVNIKKYCNVYILRSFTKIYHLSGVRLGYVISNSNNIKKIKHRQPTWSVNSIAQKFALYYLQDDEFIKRTKIYYYNEKIRLTKILKALGYEIVNSKAHFFLLKVNDDLSLIKYLLKKGIVVRHTRNFPYLKGKYIRICTRSCEENNILIKVLKEYYNENSFN